LLTYGVKGVDALSRRDSQFRPEIGDMSTLARLLMASFLLVAGSMSATSQTSGDSLKEAQRLTRVAQTAQHQGRYEDAIKAYETIAVIAKTSPQIAASALLNAGNIYMAGGRFAQAANAYKTSLIFDPNSAE